MNLSLLSSASNAAFGKSFTMSRRSCGKAFAGLFGLLMLLLTLPTPGHAQTATVTLKDVAPADSTVITSFDFDLTFDLTAAANANGSYGLGVALNVNDRTTNDIEVKLADGTVVWTEKIPKIVGTDPEFKVGDTIHLSVPGLNIVDGMDYIIDIYCNVAVQRQGDDTNLTTVANIRKELHYTARTDEKKFAFKDWGFEKGDRFESIDALEMHFTSPVKLAPGASVDLLTYLGAPGESRKATYYRTLPLAVKESDPSTVLIQFGGGPLYANDYKLELPDDIFMDASDPSYVIPTPKPDFRRVFYGDSWKHFKIKEYKLAKDSFGLPVGFDITFSELHPNLVSISMPTVTVYYDEDTYAFTTGNSYADFTVDDSGEMTFRYDFGRMATPKPGMTCHLSLSENRITARDDKGFICYSPEGDVYLEAYLPPVSETAAPRFDLRSVGFRDFNNYESVKGLEDGYATDFVDVLEFICTSPTLNGTTVHDVMNVSADGGGSDDGYLYEISPEGDRLVKTINLATTKRGNNALTMCPTFVATINEPLMKGKKYRVVIPESRMLPHPYYNPNLKHYRYITNPQIEFTLTGTNETPFAVESNSLRNNDELSHLGWMTWKTLYPVGIAENAAATLSRNGERAAAMGRLSSVRKDNATYIKADFSNPVSGELLALEPGEYSLELPAGAVHYISDPDITNPVHSTVLNGKADVALADVKLNITSEGGHTHTVGFKAPLESRARITLTSPSDWTPTMTLDDEEVANRRGIYTVNVVSPDPEINLSLAYNKEMNVDRVTGVASVDPSGFRVYAADGSIVIENLEAGDSVGVFTPDGAAILTGNVKAATPRLEVPAPSGEICIVAVNGYSTKILVK